MYRNRIDDFRRLPVEEAVDGNGWRQVEDSQRPFFAPLPSHFDEEGIGSGQGREGGFDGE
jgi:hypothetical protein